MMRAVTVTGLFGLLLAACGSNKEGGAPNPGPVAATDASASGSPSTPAPATTPATNPPSPATSAPPPTPPAQPAPAPALPESGTCVIVASVPYARLEQALQKAQELRSAGQAAATVLDTREVPELASGMLAVVAAIAASDEEAGPIAAALAAGQPAYKATVRACSLAAAHPIAAPADLAPLGLSTTALAFDWAAHPELAPGCYGYSTALDAVLCATGHVGPADATRLTVAAHRFPQPPGAPALPPLPAPIALTPGSSTPTPAERQAIDALAAQGGFVTLPLARPFDVSPGAAWVEPKVTVKLLMVPVASGRVGYEVTATCPEGPAVELGRGIFTGVGEPTATARVIPGTDKVVIESAHELFSAEDEATGTDHRVFVQALGVACAGGAPAAGRKDEAGGKPLVFDWVEDFDAIPLAPGCSGYSPTLDAVLCVTGLVDSDLDTGDLDVQFLRAAAEGSAADAPGTPLKRADPRAARDAIRLPPEALKPDARAQGEIDAALTAGKFVRLGAATPLGADGVPLPGGQGTLRLVTKLDLEHLRADYQVTLTCGDGATVELRKGFFDSDRRPTAAIRPISPSRVAFEIKDQEVGEGLHGVRLEAALMDLSKACAAAQPTPAPTPAPTPTP